MPWRIRGHEDAGEWDDEYECFAAAWKISAAIDPKRQRDEVYFVEPPKPKPAPRDSAFRREFLVEPWQADLAARMGVDPDVLSSAFLPAPLPEPERVGAVMVVDSDMLTRDSRGMDVVRDRLVHQIEKAIAERDWEQASEVEFTTEKDMSSYQIKVIAQCTARPRVEYPHPALDPLPYLGVAPDYSTGFKYRGVTGS